MGRRSFLLMASLTLFAAIAFGQSRAERDFRKEVAFEPGGRLTLRSDKGSVRVTGWDENRVEITARILPPDNVDQDYAQRTVEAAEIEVSGGANDLSIRSNFDKVPRRSEGFGWSRSTPEIHYEIRAPRRLNLEIHIDRSRVTLANLDGSVLMRGDRTPLEGSDLSGEIRLFMDRGQARISGLRGALEVEADRTNLNLSALAIEGDSRFQISRGELELRVPASQGASVYAGVGRRENFESDFPLTMNALRRETIEGTINGGGPRLVFGGDRNHIRLRKM